MRAALRHLALSLALCWEAARSALTRGRCELCLGSGSTPARRSHHGSDVSVWGVVRTCNECGGSGRTR